MNRTHLMNMTLPDSKHKHMMRSGAPHDKLGVLYHMVTSEAIEFNGFTSIINSKVITLWFLVLSQFFRDGMGPFKVASDYEFCACYISPNHDLTITKSCSIVCYGCTKHFSIHILSFEQLKGVITLLLMRHHNICTIH